MRRTGWAIAAALGVMGVLRAGALISRVRIVGWSMSPTLQDNERRWIRKPLRGSRFREGQIVVFRHVRGHGSPPLLIKRVALVVEGDDGCYLEVRGDNANSSSSNELGLISTASVVGILVNGRL